MEKYRLIQEHSHDGAEYESTTHDNRRRTMVQPDSSGFPEVRITQQGKPRNYISYAMSLLSDGSSTIVLKAMGRAINKAVTIAEILKRKTPLHQWNALSSVEMIDIYEPVEEGLDLVHSRRYISCMTITLSVSLLTDPTSMDIHHIGYQPPLPAADLQKREFHLSSQQQQQPRYMVAATP